MIIIILITPTDKSHIGRIQYNSTTHEFNINTDNNPRIKINLLLHHFILIWCW